MTLGPGRQALDWGGVWFPCAAAAGLLPAWGTSDLVPSLRAGAVGSKTGPGGFPGSTPGRQSGGHS